VDSAITGALIGAAATLGAALITVYVNQRRKARVANPREQSLPPSTIADITGSWHSQSPNESETITIQTSQGRKVSGIRIFTGRDGVQRIYDVEGYFDGTLLALAASSQNPQETRTLAIVMQRKTGTRFVGRRTYLAKKGIVSNAVREWRRKT
jgi:hypothetical protein